MTAIDLALKLKEQFGELISEPSEFRGEITVIVMDSNRINEVCAFAKQSLGFDYLVDITSIDNYGQEPRWTIVYELFGYSHRCYLRLKTNITEAVSRLPSVSNVWRTANWHEREIYDMMGIKFDNHPDLRRILMWEGYPFYPLRKDFPLEGKPSEVPGVAFTQSAPLEGGPFVTTPGKTALKREPRARPTEDAC
ncbi:MAG: NADH-quinone oxidoreductase subunit C [Verrucomicrobiia bacterium]